MEGVTALSLLPPALALAMIIVTRRVLPSLGAGILTGALILNDWGVLSALSDIWDSFAVLFVTDGALNDWELFIILFLLLLGITASLISFSGGSRAFGNWALHRIKTRTGAQIATFVFGILIFIDDYFNSLTVGQVSRPVTDRHRISRAKLAYIVDSAAAPICVLAPLSSWGAYIITLLDDITSEYSDVSMSGFQTFLAVLPMNFYALSAITLLFFVILWNIDIGPMRRHEERALLHHQLLDPNRSHIPGEQVSNLDEHNGRVRDLVIPIAALIVSTVIFMVYTGVRAAETVTPITIFAETDVALSLVLGGCTGLIVSVLFTFGKRPAAGAFLQAVWNGARSMLPAIYILILAWMIVSFIEELQTGEYIAWLIDGNVSASLLPAILFITAGLIAFSTGTSWGTFTILLPIAADTASVIDITMLLPFLAAVIAGAILGDHISPISDTTILSSTGAGSHHIDHVITQLPYAIIAAAVSFVGFIVLGVTGSTTAGLAVSLVLLLLTALYLKNTIETLHDGKEVVSKPE
ncbi:Na+/H+ antiporter NhaC family protein [Salibacterium halotolerans]|uniref:Tetracycline resistance efflux pump n=1 Tax=Salibacterium halotolerans TaxID=1884432 RepID=A0A1I5XE06_9BACI|nr:Na+/H+ antiporter NhaC family protein [Salibacterium halotolerans]SFQ30181.1 tetracycline resistance efflux pump [Salibacterium halotolerans]